MKYKLFHVKNEQQKFEWELLMETTGLKLFWEVPLETEQLLIFGGQIAD